MQIEIKMKIKVMNEEKIEVLGRELKDSSRVVQ